MHSHTNLKVGWVYRRRNLAWVNNQISPKLVDVIIYESQNLRCFMLAKEATAISNRFMIYDATQQGIIGSTLR